MAPEHARNLAVAHWQGLRVEHPQWALRAYARLVSTLSPQVQQRLQVKEAEAEPYVVVFGKTQVGKTTLLLDLMGVAPAQMARVSTVLRGGREAGQSATATTMEYCRSASELWGLGCKGEPKWFAGDQAMAEALGGLRVRMEAGQLHTGTAPWVVHVPRGCFVDGAKGPGVRMLDLPGDKPSNEQEQRHVHLMAKTYLPFADLILLVGRGDDLSFLRAGELALPGIEDWQAMPYRFRIVTTYSYFAKSAKDFLREHPDADTVQVRQRLLNEAQRFGAFSEAARQERLFFPLEFGNSWQNTAKDDPLLHARMAPIITGLRDELLAQICSNTTPMGRMLGTLQAHVSVRYIQQQKTYAVEHALNELATRRGVSETEVKSWSSLSQTSTAHFETIREVMGAQPYQKGIVAIDVAAKALQDDPEERYWPKAGGVEDDRETLYTLIRDYRRVLTTLRLEVSPDSIPLSFWRQVRKQFNEPPTRAIDSALEAAFGWVRGVLSDYWFDTYLSSDNYQKDRGRVREAGANALELLVDLWKNQWLEALVGTERAFIEAARVAQAQAAAHKQEAEHALQRHRLITQAIDENATELERIAQDSKDDLERCERYVGLLKEEYGTELCHRYTKALAEVEPVDALMGLLSCVALRLQYAEFMQVCEPATA
ncbi:hypothetical protein [Pseudomonas capsici]|uniref:Dynamin family protein n=1 Tax=Pseudomonas capsici TaxID=2810614 RepID=A0ABT3C460_9PSED|nr:hypothetical protein [Pseudomonas capsici]MBN6717187.1 hypothetical protein [Pseudomonas capsici]MBN6722251.1 hypothetical protein [Pseudomonas capsici]MBN6727149.1 hypothetical protein [Pseudomonas capsici]MCV4270868.1 dynamin family protein [Pseudomonas capsici]MCV4281018.1 dynamin family protein [Pseudomonas capsici]